MNLFLESRKSQLPLFSDLWCPSITDDWYLDGLAVGVFGSPVRIDTERFLTEGGPRKVWRAV